MWIWRDLSLRAGFREVVDQIGDGGSSMIVDYWAARIEEEIGDNRFIKALEEIANDPANAVTHFEDKWRTIAKRALGPRCDEQAAAAGVKQYAAADGVHVVQPELFGRMSSGEHMVAAALRCGAYDEHPVLKEKLTKELTAAGEIEEIADI